jgi:hypothetical protein
MSEPDFTQLRDRLSALARPPAFEQIVHRRTRRTRRLAMAVSAVATVVAIVVVSAASVVLRGAAPPQPPIGSTSTPVSPTPDDGAVSAVPAITGMRQGLIMLAPERCPTGAGACRGTSWDVYLVQGVPPYGPWVPAGTVTDLPVGAIVRPLAADQNRLWVLAGHTVSVTIDGGATWAHTDLGGAGGDEAAGSAGGGAAWFVRGADVWISTGGPPLRVARPSGHALQRVVSVSVSQAYVQTDEGVWYTTHNGGHGWNRLSDPCAGTRYAYAGRSSLAVAESDRTIWVVCAGEPGAGQMGKVLVVSTDNGATWTGRGELESSGYATEVYPVSATTAWRVGDRASLYRTADGVHWTAVATSSVDAFAGVAAMDESAAAYLDPDAHGVTRLHVTFDGGATWTAVPMP